jgi:hypothetical protein
MKNEIKEIESLELKSVNKKLPLLIGASNELIAKTDIKSIKKINDDFELVGIENKTSVDLNKKSSEYYDEKRSVGVIMFIEKITEAFSPMKVVLYSDMIKFCKKNELYIAKLSLYNENVTSKTLSLMNGAITAYSDVLSILNSSTSTQNQDLIKIADNKSACFYKHAHKVLDFKLNPSKLFYAIAPFNSFNVDKLKDNSIIGREILYDNELAKLKVSDLNKSKINASLFFSTIVFDKKIYCVIVDTYGEVQKDDFKHLI